ncbi:sulfotransferase family protein [Citreicella sp. C3M06]|uniref:sulfotransferase family 2 domain-containing protein n=1 Tax=Citreicella sp. C3M06 TaxID=2841564 RepID=UPI001C082897|nr:sulfotransferase family 2 domain-containing protein [Citreicella sp. C3M06]MBU2963483.1 sulfotransferase family protein [Citreicella sp. C3M06]
MLSLAHQFLFLHVPKTAGNSIQRALLPFSEDTMALLAPHQDGVDRFEIRSPTLEMHKHLELSEYRKRLPAEQFGALFKFCGVRNPWDRCVSYFFSPHRGVVDWSPKAFAAFVDKDIRTASSYVSLASDETDAFANVDAVLRFEQLEDDFAQLCRRIGIATPHLPKANAGDHGDYRTYYTDPRMIDHVAQKFSAEIERFGYAFE